MSRGEENERGSGAMSYGPVPEPKGQTNSVGPCLGLSPGRAASIDVNAEALRLSGV